MNYLILIFIIILTSCSKPKSVFICGDHVCVNKKEANKYFEENLSIQVKIINKNELDEPDLIELNMIEDDSNKKKIFAKKKDSINEPLKILTKEEVKKIKKEVKKRKNKEKKIKAKPLNEDGELKVTSSENIKVTKKTIIDKSNVNNKILKKGREDVIDVCSILDRCNIEEISKYLIKEGKNKKFPNITLRE